MFFFWNYTLDKIDFWYSETDRTAEDMGTKEQEKENEHQKGITMRSSGAMMIL